MKKIILMLAMVLPTLASAQKLAYINSQELFAQMPELKVVEQKLDSLNKEYEALLTTMQEEYQKKLSDYQQKQATMTDAIRQISEEEIMSLQQRIQTTYQTAQQDVQKQERELLVPIQSKMVKAIQEVGAANGYTYIFDTTATLYVGADAINLMSEVKKALGIQ